ncbi:MAG: DUF2304 family protein [Lachnospiraceae bacterium]|nr:DUF2304 family protein [Lachnospiraceae bacterium]
MSQTLRILLLVVALLTAIWILWKIRKLKVKMEDAIFWVIFAFLLAILGIFPELTYWMTTMLRMMSPANLIFLVIIFLLLEKVFTLSIIVSQLEDKLTVLSAEVALRAHSAEHRLDDYDVRMPDAAGRIPSGTEANMSITRNTAGNTWENADTVRNAAGNTAKNAGTVRNAAGNTAKNAGTVQNAAGAAQIRNATGAAQGADCTSAQDDIQEDETAKTRHHYIPEDHTFVISAYQESPYLEECVCSCLRQSAPGKVMITTSTPNDHIRKVAEKYEVPLKIREEKNAAAQGEARTEHTEHVQNEDLPGNTIGLDWNFALEAADTPFVTIAHQDDRYNSKYTERILEAANRCKHPLILFTDYAELRDGKIQTTNKLLKVKRSLLMPLIPKRNWKNKWIRRRVLSMGNPICAPTVTLAVQNIKHPFFENNMISNIDWQAWEELSRQDGEFAYIPVPSMLHRIHEDSTTSKLLDDDGRREEDLKVFRKFWPSPVANMIENVYQSAEKSNQLEGEKGKA